MATGDKLERGPLGWIAFIIGGIWFLLTRTALFALTVLFLIGLVFFFSAMSSNDVVVVEDGSALRVSLAGVMVEKRRPLDALPSPFGSDQPVVVLQDVVRSLKEAKRDDRIAGAVIEISGAALSTSHALVVADAINDFRADGKEVIAFGDYLNGPRAVVASAADEAWLHAIGDVLLDGYAIQPLFFADLLEKARIDLEIFRVGTFKAAVEPFIRNNMSPEYRENLAELGDGLWSAARAHIAEGRGIDPADVDRYALNFADLIEAAGGDSARAARAAGLVDHLVDVPGFEAQMIDRFGGGENGGAPYRSVAFDDYVEAVRAPVRKGVGQVAVIYATGDIAGGESEAGVMGADTITSLLIEAANNPNVKALVIRVDSPGGGAFASELIRNRVEQVKAAGKPVVVSMGTYAASGGYWIAADADRIFAHPTTQTGSIGIFAIIPKAPRALEAIGVRSDGVAYTPYSDAFDITRPMTEQSRRIIQASIEDGYGDFLERVANGRGMTVEEVDQIAQGRVWLGARALQLGLVDELGGQDDAVAAAAELAGLSDYDTVVIEEPLTFTEQLLLNLANVAAPRLAGLSVLDHLWLRPIRPALDQLSFLIRAPDPRSRYVVCEACLAAAP